MSAILALCDRQYARVKMISASPVTCAQAGPSRTDDPKRRLLCFHHRSQIAGGATGPETCHALHVPYDSTVWYWCDTSGHMRGGRRSRRRSIRGPAASALRCRMCRHETTSAAV